MMAVGDVERRHGVERGDKRRDQLVRHAPHDMPHAIGRGEVEEWRTNGRRVHHRVHGRRGAIGEEHGAGLRP